MALVVFVVLVVVAFGGCVALVVLFGACVCFVWGGAWRLLHVWCLRLLCLGWCVALVVCFVLVFVAVPRNTDA